MGIIFIENGSPFVYEAAGDVKYTPLQTWIERGEGGHYVIKRLSDVGSSLTPITLGRLRQVAKEFRGKPYDASFGWSDDEIYCSELVWKIYYRGLGVEIGHLQKLGDFDLSDELVRAKLQERYGTKIPLNEQVISPEEMFSSDLLITVDRR